MKIQDSLIYLLFLILLLSGTKDIAFAKDFQVGSFFIPDLVVDKNEGSFVELYNEIIKRIREHKFLLEIYPAKRTKKMFDKGELDILFPITNPDEKYPKSASIYEKKSYIFVLDTVPLINTMEQLAGKRVGLVAGFRYDPKISDCQHIKYEWIPDNDITGMKMLSIGRLDAFIAEEKSGLGAIRTAGITNIRYDAENPVEVRNTFFIFQQNSEGEMLSGRFSEIIRELRQEGIYDRIFKEKP